MKTYDMLENTRGGLTAFSEGHFEKTLRLSMCMSERLSVYTFADGLRLRFSEHTYPHRVAASLKTYIRDHGEPISHESITITR